MRIINRALSVVLFLFALAQYNDPDAVFWICVYGVGAIWSGLAATDSALLAKGATRTVFGLTLAASIIGVAWFWPIAPNWWMQDVWWDVETAREGMGMMIVTATLLLASFGIFRARA